MSVAELFPIVSVAIPFGLASLALCAIFVGIIVTVIRDIREDR